MIDQLLKPEIQKFIQLHANADIRQLALQKRKYADWPFELILDQIQSRQKAKKKLPSWFGNKGILFPPSISMEQCSSELSAKYKATLVKGEDLLDLTGGFGVDLSFLLRSFVKGYYVDQNEWLCDLAKHNFSALRSKVEVSNISSSEALEQVSSVDTIYLDPARRNDTNHKVIRLEDYSPNVLELLPEILAKSKNYMLKVSPMFDIKLGIEQLLHVDQVHVVSVKNEVKELLFVGSQTRNVLPNITCVNLDSDQPIFEFSYALEENLEVPLGPVSEYLYEPNASIIKSGAFKSIASRFELIKLHPNTHLYTSKEIKEKFPGRVFRIREELKPNKKEVRKSIPSLQANVSTRNYPLSANDLIKKIGLKEGGDQFIFGFTDIKAKRVVLCEKLK